MGCSSKLYIIRRIYDVEDKKPIKLDDLKAEGAETQTENENESGDENNKFYSR